MAMILWSACRVDHGHQADGAGVNDGERDDGFLAEHEDVERIVIFGEGLRNESRSLRDSKRRSRGCDRA